eukprot:Rhum_TRINITY_DN12981_c1_g1::Rhum_TRINITY_DN12981_c1_g1_i1::g.55851::m.55851
MRILVRQRDAAQPRSPQTSDGAQRLGSCIRPRQHSSFAAAAAAAATSLPRLPLPAKPKHLTFPLQPARTRVPAGRAWAQHAVQRRIRSEEGAQHKQIPHSQRSPQCGDGPSLLLRLVRRRRCGQNGCGDAGGRSCPPLAVVESLPDTGGVAVLRQGRRDAVQVAPQGLRLRTPRPHELEHALRQQNVLPRRVALGGPAVPAQAAEERVAGVRTREGLAAAQQAAAQRRRAPLEVCVAAAVLRQLRQTPPALHQGADVGTHQLLQAQRLADTHVRLAQVQDAQQPQVAVRVCRKLLSIPALRRGEQPPPLRLRQHDAVHEARDVRCRHQWRCRRRRRRRRPARLPRRRSSGVGGGGAPPPIMET